MSSDGCTHCTLAVFNISPADRGAATAAAGGTTTASQLRLARRWRKPCDQARSDRAQHHLFRNITAGWHKEDAEREVSGGGGQEGRSRQLFGRQHPELPPLELRRVGGGCAMVRHGFSRHGVRGEEEACGNVRRRLPRASPGVSVVQEEPPPQRAMCGAGAERSEWPCSVGPHRCRAGAARSGAGSARRSRRSA